MLTLALETATEHASVVLWQEGVELAAWREVTRQDLLLRLAGEVGRLLARAGREFADLDLLCVGLGPGSFTSLRVGLATAKGFSLAYGAPLVGIGSLAAMAWQKRTQVTGIACPVLDAKRGELYAGFFRAAPEGVTRLGEEFVADPAALRERLAALGQPVTVFGQTDLLSEKETAQSVGEGMRVLREEVIVPDAAAVAELGERRFADSGGDDLGALHPLYVRKSYAEEKFDVDLGLR